MQNVTQQTDTIEDDEIYIALEHVESWTGRIKLPTGEIFFESQVKQFRTGDVLFGKLRPYLAKVTMPTVNGVCVGEFFVLRPCTNNIFAAYLEKILRSKPTIDIVNSSTFGAKMPRANWQSVGSLVIPLPPPDEQAAIARYLDWADGRIRRLIRARQKQIKLLEEYKQVIIQQAVTGQIDVSTGKPYPAYKDSGVEWLGQVPEHWEVTLGRKGFYERKAVINVGFIEKKVLSLSYGKIIVKPVEKMHGLMPASYETYQLIDVGDIICRPTDLQNDQKSLRFGFSNQKGIITSAYMRLATQSSLSPKFGYLLLHTYDLIKIIYKFGSGLRQNLSWKDFKQLPILIPPKPEQKEIVRFVEEKIVEIDKAVSIIQNALDVLKEYQTRLIADVVTGKVDVRQAAEKLPALEEELEEAWEDDEIESEEDFEEAEDAE